MTENSANLIPLLVDIVVVHMEAAKCPQQMVASSGEMLEPSRPTNSPPDLTHHRSLPSSKISQPRVSA